MRKISSRYYYSTEISKKTTLYQIVERPSISLTILNSSRNLLILYILLRFKELLAKEILLVREQLYLTSLTLLTPIESYQKTRTYYRLYRVIFLVRSRSIKRLLSSSPYVTLSIEELEISLAISLSLKIEVLVFERRPLNLPINPQ